MSTLIPLQTLRGSLDKVVKTIFDLGLRNCWEATGEESYILLLSRATGGVESFLQRLARGWGRLEPNTQAFICAEWKDYCDERLKDLRRPCDVYSISGVLCAEGCLACSNKIKLNARELEDYTKEFSAMLEREVYFPSSKNLLQIDGEESELKKAKLEQEEVRHQLQKTKYELDNTHQEHAKTRTDLGKAYEELETARQEHANTHEELETERQEHAKTHEDLETARQEHAKTHEDLETARQEHANTRTDLGMVREELETARQEHANTSTDLGKAHEELETANQELDTVHQELEEIDKEFNNSQKELGVIRQELEIAGNKIQNFTSALDAAGKWEVAAEGYEELHRMEDRKLDWLKLNPDNDEAVKDAEIKSIEFQHKLITVLIKQNNSRKAEPIAKQVWDKRKDLLTTKSHHTRESFLNYCHILRLNGTYHTAENIYKRELTSEDLDESSPVDRKWKLDIEYELGSVLVERGRNRQAENCFRSVVESAVKNLPKSLNDAVTSAVQAIALLKKQKKSLDEDFSKDLERIWDEWKQTDNKRGVLICGHELGVYLHHQESDFKAEPILRNVWAERKIGNLLQADILQDAISSAECLAEVCESLRSQKTLEYAEEVHTWICEMKPIDLNKPDTFTCRYSLALMQLELDHFEAAETVLSQAWLVAKGAPKESYGIKLECGYTYGYVLVELKKWQEAREVLEAALAEPEGHIHGNREMRDHREMAQELLEKEVMGELNKPLDDAAKENDEEKQNDEGNGVEEKSEAEEKKEGEEMEEVSDPKEPKEEEKINGKDPYEQNNYVPCSIGNRYNPYLGRQHGHEFSSSKLTLSSRGTLGSRSSRGGRKTTKHPNLRKFFSMYP